MTINPVSGGALPAILPPYPDVSTSDPSQAAANLVATLQRVRDFLTNAGVGYSGVPLFFIPAANMAATTDQVSTAIGATTPYILRRITALNGSSSMTTAAGGFYTAASKGGSTLVANTQVFTALSAASKFVDLTLASAATTDVQTAAPILSLTTPKGTAATADFIIFGDRII